MGLFFLCSYPLEKGSVVQPGNWGRILNMYTFPGGNAWVLMREVIFEEIRKQQFASLPSRLEATFLCEFEHEARDFQNRAQRWLDLLYEVEICDPTRPQHRACLNHADLEQGDRVPNLIQKAHAYWSGQGVQRPEIITASSIRIIRGPI